MRTLRARVLRSSLGGALCLALGCSLLVDPSDIDARCAAGQKICGNRCVDELDPRYGCTLKACDPCPLAAGIPKCENYECVPEPCLYGYGCPNCTTNVLSDINHCGACGSPCGSGELCLAGVCTPR